MSQAASAPALPSDLLHGLALRPPVAAWDGLRYRGSVPLHARLQDAQAMAGVVASVQRGHFLGVVAVAPVHARQAAASLAPAWDNRQEAKAASDARDDDRDGIVGYDSSAQRKREFAADMGIQAFSLRMAAEGAVAAYEHAVGESWKPFDRPVDNPGQTLDRKAAEAQMDALG